MVPFDRPDSKKGAVKQPSGAAYPLLIDLLHGRPDLEGSC